MACRKSRRNSGNRQRGMVFEALILLCVPYCLLLVHLPHTVMLAPTAACWRSELCRSRCEHMMAFGSFTPGDMLESPSSPGASSFYPPPFVAADHADPFTHLRPCNTVDLLVLVLMILMQATDMFPKPKAASSRQMDQDDEARATKRDLEGHSNQLSLLQRQHQEDTHARTGNAREREERENAQDSCNQGQQTFESDYHQILTCDDIAVSDCIIAETEIKETRENEDETASDSFTFDENDHHDTYLAVRQPSRQQSREGEGNEETEEGGDNEERGQPNEEGGGEEKVGCQEDVEGDVPECGQQEDRQDSTQNSDNSSSKDIDVHEGPQVFPFMSLVEESQTPETRLKEPPGMRKHSLEDQVPSRAFQYKRLPSRDMRSFPTEKKNKYVHAKEDSSEIEYLYSETADYNRQDSGGTYLVFMCPAANDGMQNELARYATFSHYTASSEGVWATRLAKAGFYCPQEGSKELRCAFCRVSIDSSKFRGDTDPMEVHKDQSPNCPLVAGNDCGNASLDMYYETFGQEYLQAMFEGPGRQPLETPAKSENTAAGRSLCPQGARSNPSPSPPEHPGTSATAAQYQLPPPGQRVTSQDSAANEFFASTTQYSLSLPTNVNSDGHQSWVPPSQQVHVLAALPAQSSNLASERQASPQASLQETPREQPSLSQTPSPQTLAQTTSTGPTRNSGEEAHSDQRQRPESRPDSSTSPTGSSSTPQPGSSQQPPPSSSAPAESSRTENPPPSTEPPRQVVTYAQLGIFTQQPKRQDMVVAATRCNTFTGWPHAHTHDPEEMAEAGFYYTGHGDLVRCFYCKGGLKSWADNLRPWVEHARFFPECPYVNQVKGHLYVEVVKDLHEKQEAVTPQDVEDELKRRKRIPILQENATEIAAESETAWMSEGGAVGGATSCPEPGSRETDLTRCVEKLTSEIHEATEERMCKICQVNEVNILFLPCGHLVSCAQCAPALRTCAVCRQRVKGRVRVYMNEEDC